MLAVVRHGAREDDLPRNRKQNSEVYFDPALSSLGEVQSQATGKYMAEYFRRKGFLDISTSIRIISSPFLRTLQTAVIIADELRCKEVQIWNPICEELKENLFESFPIPHLNFYLHDVKFIQEKFLKGKKIKLIEMEDPEEILTPLAFPENEARNSSSKPSTRAKLSIDYILQNQFSHYSNDSNELLPQIIILVTHAFFLDPFVQYFSRETHCNDRNYCSISLAKHFDNSWKLVENCSSEHII